jgi:hypothetical protein
MVDDVTAIYLRTGEVDSCPRQEKDWVSGRHGIALVTLYVRVLFGGKFCKNVVRNATSSLAR